MITNKRLFRLGCVLFWIFLFGVVGGSVNPNTALAATVTSESSSQITVTESASTMAYGDTAPSFQARLTVPIDEPLTNDANFYILIDSHRYNGYVSGDAPTYSLYVAGVGAATPLPIGRHSVFAVYNDLYQTKTVESAPVTLTVLKTTPELTCSINNLAYTYAPNTSLTIAMSFSNTNAPVDWQHATYTLTFVGAHSVTRANLKPNKFDQVTALAPPMTGNYQLRCIFNGTSTFNSAGFSLSVLVSSNHQSSIKLYTNPTTLKAGKLTTWYVVVSGVSGLPAPTGSINITIGNAYTGLITLGRGGKVTMHGNAPLYLNGASIKIFYFGDPVYASHSATFSLKNPPIPK